MYCINCGKQIKDGSRFCKYCGSGQTEGTPVDSGYTRNSWDNPAIKQSQIMTGNFTAIDLGIVILYIILGIRWIAAFFGNIKNTWNVFGFMEADMRLLLMLVYILPFAIFLLIGAIGILNVRNQEYHVSIAVILAIVGLIMKIGAAIFDSYSIMNKVKLVAYQVFSVYGSIGIFTIIVCVVIAILLHAKMTGSGR